MSRCVPSALRSSKQIANAVSQSIFPYLLNKKMPNSTNGKKTCLTTKKADNFRYPLRGPSRA